MYERLAPELTRFATTLVGPSDAEDLLGAAVLKAISAPRWSAIDNKRAYLYRIITNEAARRSGRGRAVANANYGHIDVTTSSTNSSIRR